MRHYIAKDYLSDKIYPKNDKRPQEDNNVVQRSPFSCGRIFLRSNVDGGVAVQVI